MPTAAQCPRMSSLLDRLKPRERKYVFAVIAGRSSRQAALEAGYTAAVADKALQRVAGKPAVQAALHELINLATPPKRLVEILAEGLDAVKITVINGKKRSARLCSPPQLLTACSEVGRVLPREAGEQRRAKA